MTRRMTTLLNDIAADDDLLAAFRERPRETAASMGVEIDDETLRQMQLLEDDAVIDFVCD